MPKNTTSKEEIHPPLMQTKKKKFDSDHSGPVLSSLPASSLRSFGRAFSPTNSNLNIAAAPMQQQKKRVGTKNSNKSS